MVDTMQMLGLLIAQYGNCGNGTILGDYNDRGGPKKDTTWLLR